MRQTIPNKALLVTVPQAALALQVSQRTIFNLISKGMLESIQIGGTRRINMEVLKLVASMGTVERTGQAGRPRKIKAAEMQAAA
jgi:excisionase family DNA binding protein